MTSASTLCQHREAGSLCRRMADHDGDHDLAPDTSERCPWMLTNPEAAGALRCRLANGHDGACLPPVTRGRFNDADWTPPAGEGAAEPDCEHEYERGIESCAECDQTRGRHESWCGEGAAEQPQCMCPANEVGGIHHPSCPVRGVPQGR